MYGRAFAELEAVMTMYRHARLRALPAIANVYRKSGVDTLGIFTSESLKYYSQPARGAYTAFATWRKIAGTLAWFRKTRRRSACERI